MGPKPGSGKEDNLKLWGAFRSCADRRYQWIRCGGGGPGPLPGDGTVLGSDAAAAILRRGERPGQQGEASERASGHLPAPTL